MLVEAFLLSAGFGLLDLAGEPRWSLRALYCLYVTLYSWYLASRVELIDTLKTLFEYRTRDILPDCRNWRIFPVTCFWYSPFISWVENGWCFDRLNLDEFRSIELNLLPPNLRLVGLSSAKVRTLRKFTTRIYNQFQQTTWSHW